MQKIYKLLIFMGLVIFLTGCGSASSEDLDNQLKTNGNCNVVECIKQINPENTVEEINQIIGINGELTDETYNKYYWKLSDDSGIEVVYYSADKGTISIDIDKTLLANKKVDFSKNDELKAKIKDGLTYDEFKSYVGNVDGIITEKSSSSTKYTWVDSEGSYVTATFSNSTNKCSYASGMVK